MAAGRSVPRFVLASQRCRSRDVPRWTPAVARGSRRSVVGLCSPPRGTRSRDWRGGSLPSTILAPRVSVPSLQDIRGCRSRADPSGSHCRARRFGAIHAGSRHRHWLHLADQLCRYLRNHSANRGRERTAGRNSDRRTRGIRVTVSQVRVRNRGDEKLPHGLGQSSGVIKCVALRFKLPASTAWLRRPPHRACGRRTSCRGKGETDRMGAAALCRFRRRMTEKPRAPATSAQRHCAPGRFSRSLVALRPTRRETDRLPGRPPIRGGGSSANPVKRTGTGSSIVERRGSTWAIAVLWRVSAARWLHACARDKQDGPQRCGPQIYSLRLPATATGYESGKGALLCSVQR